MIIKFRLEKDGFGNVVSNEDYTVNPKTNTPLYNFDEFGTPVKHDETFSHVSNASILLDVEDNYDAAKMNVFVDMIMNKLIELSSKKMRKTHYDWDKRTINRPAYCHIRDVDHYVSGMILDYNFNARNLVCIQSPRPPTHGVKLHLVDLVAHQDTDDWKDLIDLFKSMVHDGTYDDHQRSGYIVFNPTQQQIEDHSDCPYRDVLKGHVNKLKLR